MTTSLKRTTLPEQLAERVRMRILRGALGPGARLREEQIAAAYDTTRTTVRDALRILEHEGLVVREIHRGVRVRQLDAAEVEDILLMRLAIEPQVVRRAVEARLDLTGLHPAVDRLEAAARAGDAVRYGEADIRFHSELLETAGSARLAAFFAGTLRLLKLAMLRADERLSAEMEHVLEHQQILERIEAGDADGAAALMTRHLERARGDLKPATRNPAP